MKPLSQANRGQPFSSTSSCSAPSSPCHPVHTSTPPQAAHPSPALMLSPAHKPQGSGVKKVTGVGGTTYEISVWVAASLHLTDQWDKVDITVFMTQQLPVVDVGHLDSWLAVWPRSPTLIQLLHTGIKDLDSCEAGLKNGLKLLIQPGSMLVTSASVWLSQLTSTAAKRH